MMIHSYEPVSEREWTLKGVDDPTGAKLLEDEDPRSLVDQRAKKVGQAAASQSKQTCVASYQEQTADKSHAKSCVFIRETRRQDLQSARCCSEPSDAVESRAADGILRVGKGGG